MVFLTITINSYQETSFANFCFLFILFFLPEDGDAYVAKDGMGKQQQSEAGDRRDNSAEGAEGARLPRRKNLFLTEVEKLRWMTCCQIVVLVMAALLLVLSVAMLAGGYRALTHAIMQSVSGAAISARVCV